MIKFNKKTGFSLAESIISIMILSLVIMLTLASITRKKTTPVNKTTISGIYACWNDGSELKQKHFNGHILASSGVTGSECEFNMDRRAYKYYVYAVGSRKCDGVCVDGQVVQEIVPTPSGADEAEMVLKIDLGDIKQGASNKNGGITTVTQNRVKIAEALGGIIKNDAKLVHGNLKSCKLIGGNPCRDERKPKCEIQNSINETYKKEAKNPNRTSVVITCTENENNEDKKLVNSDDIHQVSINNLMKMGEGNEIYYQPKTDSKPQVKIQEKDSSTIAKKNPLTRNSPFVKYLKMIPQNVQNGLTDELLQYYQKDNGEKYGVVLIIW